MTKTDDGTAEALFGLLDFTPDIPCEVPRCDRRADGYVLSRCCCGDGGAVPSCRRCYKTVRRMLRLLTGSDLLRCRTCGRRIGKHTSITWEPWT